MTTKELKSLIEQVMDENMEYEFFGIRTQEQPFALGDIDHTSKVWEDGDETDEDLDGICATNAESRMIRWHADDHGDGYYFGGHQAILASNDVEYGEDDGEIIMKDAVVVYVIR